MPLEKNNPPKKQKMQDIASFSCTPDNPGSSRLTERTQPGGATGGAKSRSAGSDPGRATSSQDNPGSSRLTERTQPGGAPGGAKSGAAGSDPGDGGKFSQPSKDAGSNLGGATGSQTRSQVKKENGDGSTDKHLHRVTVKFNPTESKKFPIHCDHRRTVLEVIKSTENYKKKMKNCSDENIVIALGEARELIVATHFPCTCIGEDESLLISSKSQKVEVTQDQTQTPIQSRDEYSVFYIDTVGGPNSTSKKLFRNIPVKKFKYLCVYGEKGMTVEEALKRDGRFIDDLGDFTLTDYADPDSITECTQKVDHLDQKKLKICLAPKKGANYSLRSSNNSPQMCDTTPAVDETQQRKIRAVVEKRGLSVRAAMEKSGNSVDIEENYEILRRQFTHLKKRMESRFPGDSFQKALNLRKENFGKIQQSFSEVHRVRKLLKLGKSVCKVVVGDVCQGTGFVLFDNFILTNAHLFRDCVEGQKLKEGIEVYFLFNYEDPEPHTNYYYFELAHHDICYTQGDLDYAVLELNPESQKSNHSTQTKKMKVPPGLLKIFGPMPENGEACLIGHPAGGLKKMDPTFIIEKERRVQAVCDHLHPYTDSHFIVYLRDHLIKVQGIENIMIGGNKADKVVTYNTFMYHGSSGSPVFDARGRVFGLHTDGYPYEFQNHKKSVIEFAQSLLTIFEHFVRLLKERGLEKLLERVKKEVKGNSDLEKVFQSVDELQEVQVKAEPAEHEDSSDSCQSMYTD
ncbi:serine protease FAM111A-like [Perca fluviatilis]|uniref:serine protease FAM111A-like n=1 Tax=Perca fluviatilis TaxID=8168 RepID=UPI0019668924|nr:serine protease FAM111A-like [Perca fluviatilis]